MKKTLSFCAFFALLSVNAQYFEHAYGVPMAVNKIGSGLFTDYTGKGHLLTGKRVLPNSSELLLIRTEQNGRILPGPYFKNSYLLYDLSASVNYDVLNSKAMEFNNVSYGVVGTCQIDVNTGQQALFYTNFDQNGTPILSKLYLANLNSQQFKINNVRVADSGQEFYVCGMAFDGVQNYALVMKIDILTGAIIWANNYIVDTNVLSGEPEEAYDLIEYPLLGQLLVVGQRHVCVGTSDDGYIMHLNPVDGNFLAPTDFYGSNSSADSYTTIERNSIGDAFYVGGWSGSVVNNRDTWALRFDQNNIFPTWSSLIDYQSQNIDNYGLDIMERIDSNNVANLYLLSQTNIGLIGQKDIELDQLDGLTGLNLAQNTYGNFKNDLPINFHQWNTGSTEDGIAIYSMRELPFGNHALTLHKTYFNGVTSCNYITGFQNEISGPTYLYTVKSSIVEQYSDQDFLTVYKDSLKDVETCHQNSVTGGSNAISQQIRSADNLLFEVKQNVNNEILVTVESDVEQEISIELIDLNGNIILNLGTFNLLENSNTFNFNLNSLSVNKGVYLLKSTINNKNYTQKIIKL